MTERDPMDAFETRLTALARAYTEPAAKSIDSLVTARAAMTSTSRSGGAGRWWPFGLDRRVAWLPLAAALLVALVAIALAVGTNQPPAGLGRLVFVRDGDLFTAELDGSGQTRIASGGAADSRLGYLDALWAPHGRHIAAVRDIGGEFLTPVVDLLTTDGAVVRTVALGPGGTPSITWSPDGSELAIAAYAGEVARDQVEPMIGGAIRLVVIGLDASADREIGLPPDWTGVAASEPILWTSPDFSAKWSPGGGTLAVRAFTAHNVTWQLIALDGSGTRHVDDLIQRRGSWVNALDWSPDGRRLVVSGTWDGCEVPCLGVVDPEGRTATITVAHPAAGDPDLHAKLFYPKFSPDGARIAVLGVLIDLTSDPAVTETFTLYDYELATARFTAVISETRSMIVDSSGAAQPAVPGTQELSFGTTVVWGPDSRTLLYFAQEGSADGAIGTIRSIDVAGGSRFIRARSRCPLVRRRGHRLGRVLDAVGDLDVAVRSVPDADRLTSRLVLDQVAGRERRRVLQVADHEQRDRPVGLAQGERPDGIETLGVDPDDHAVHRLGVGDAPGRPPLPANRAIAADPTNTTIRPIAKRFRVRLSTWSRSAGSAGGRTGPDGTGPAAARRVERRAVGTSRAGGLAGLEGRQVELPQRAQRVGPAGRRRSQRRTSVAPVDQHDAFDDLAAHRLHRGEHRQQRPAGRQDVVDQQDPLAGLDPEAAPELPPKRAIVAADLLGEDAADAELAGRLEGEDDAAGGRSGDEIDQQLTVSGAAVGGQERAQLARRRRILEDLELLDVGVAVASALEQEVPVAERSGLPEQRLGPDRDGLSDGGVGAGSQVVTR